MKTRQGKCFLPKQVFNSAQRIQFSNRLEGLDPQRKRLHASHQHGALAAFRWIYSARILSVKPPEVFCHRQDGYLARGVFLFCLRSDHSQLFHTPA
jgi:hypothetical protein